MLSYRPARPLLLAGFLIVVLASASCGSDVTAAGDAPSTSAGDDAQDPADVVGDSTTSIEASEPTTASDLAEACATEPLNAASSSEPKPPSDDAVVLLDLDGLRLCLGPALVDGKVIESSSVDISPSGDWTVVPVFTVDGIELFNAAAASCSTTRPDLEVCPLSRLAIVDGFTVVSSPTINADSFERDQIVIAGNLAELEARDLAASVVAEGIVFRPVLVDLGPEADS